MSIEQFMQQHGGVSEEYFFYDGAITLRYFDKEHAYYLVTDEGELEKLNGVTNVCHIIDKSEALIPWACKQMAQKLLRTAPWHRLAIDPAGPNGMVWMTADEIEKWVLAAKDAHQEKLEQAGAIGHIAHNWVEKYIKYILAEDDEGLLQHLATFPTDEKAKNGCLAALDWMVKHNVRWQATERKIYHRGWKYAGTMDGLCLVDSCDISTCTGCRGKVFADRLSVADWKTSNHLYMEYLFQTAAYEAAYEDEFGVDILDRWIIRLGKDDGEFEAWRREPEDFEMDFGGFTDALILTRRVRQVELNLQARREDIRMAEKIVRDAIRAAKEAREAEERAIAKAAKQQARVEALAKECPKAKKYKGTRAPTCVTNKGGPCEACLTIHCAYQAAKDSKKKVKKERPEPKLPDYSALESILGETVEYKTENVAPVVVPAEAPVREAPDFFNCDGEHGASFPCLSTYCWHGPDIRRLLPASTSA